MLESEEAWISRLPKAELHVHLEGSIPLPALWQLVVKYGGDSSAQSPAELEACFAYRDFPHFLEVWKWKNGFLREYEDFTFIARAVAESFQRQNIVYVEAFYSPPDFARHGLKLGRLTEAIRKGLSRVPAVEVSLIADLCREFGPETAAGTLAEVKEVTELGVIGIGLGGPEAQFPPELFAGAYRDARNAGLHVTAHAGESAGAASVRAAVEALQVERVGHGTRAIEDPSLVQELAERGIPLELCPISNVRTGVISAVENHPIRRYMEAGIPVTVNTDDPAMFGNSMVDEFLALEARLGFTRNEIGELVKQGFRCSWASDQRKESLLSTVSAA